VVLLIIGLRHVAGFGRAAAVSLVLGFWVAATSVQVALGAVVEAMINV